MNILKQLIDLFSIIAFGFLCLGNYHQIKKTLTRRSVEDISPLEVVSRFLAGAIILAKMLISADLVLVIGETAWLTTYAYYLWLVFRYREKQVATAITPTGRQPNFKKRGGLITAIVQDWKTKEVLQHGYMNPEAFEKTRATRQVWLWSTTHKALWHKGATSNSIMGVKEIRLDCDCDAIVLLVDVTGTGHACHFNRSSCFVRLEA